MSLDDDYLESIKSAPKVDFIIPALETAKEFNNVRVRQNGDVFQIQLTLMVDHQKDLPKAWKTAVALDASASMRKGFGRRLTGNIPANIAAEYEKNGWLKKETRDGCKVKVFTRPAVDDAIRRGMVSTSLNTMDFLGQEFIAYLARQLDIDGQTTLIYWAGGTGAEIEVYGDIKEAALSNLSIDGPEEMIFGKKTMLLPAVKLLVDRFAASQMAMLVFISDGRIDDLPALKQYTINLAEEIADNKHNLVRCILVGLGDNIEESSMLELDELGSTTFVNIWDHMVVNNIQDVLKMFAEIIRNTQIVAHAATIYDDQGHVLKKYPAGLPATVVFAMPITSRSFEIEVGSLRIRQPVKVNRYILEG